MSLYDIIPENLFKPLVSVNREIYIDALLVIRECYKQELMILKDDLIVRLISRLEDKMLQLQLDEGEDEDEFYKVKNSISNLAHFLVRKFIQTGWLEKEFYSHSFEEFVTVPDYAIRILNLFYELLDNKPREYNSLVYSTYAALRTADHERDDYMYDALNQAFQKTEELWDSLKSLLNNIRRYYQKLQEQTEVHQILVEHFDQYKVLITDRIYHPLKTFDSIPRFRPRILTILRSWQVSRINEQTSIVDLLSDQLIKKGFTGTKWEARQEIIHMIGKITDTYENVDQILKEIDKKNTTYTRASLERMKYLLNTDRDLKGKLIEVLKKLPKVTNSHPSLLVEQMQEGLNLMNVGLLTQDSLWREPAKRRKHNPTLENTSEPPAKEELDQEWNNVKEQFHKSFSHESIVSYIMNKLENVQELNSQDLELEVIDDFLRLLLAVIKHDEPEIPYIVEIQEGYIVINGYRIPLFGIKKR